MPPKKIEIEFRGYFGVYTSYIRVNDQSPDGSISGRDFLVTYNEYLYTKYGLK